MPRPALDFIADMTPETKRKLMSAVGVLTGMYEVTIQPKRDTRSLRANAYYWSCVVQPFFEFLRDQEIQLTDPEQAHNEIKKIVLGTFFVKTGKSIFEVPASTKKMNVEEFADYVDRARVWLAAMVGIETPDPDPMYWIPLPDRQKQSA